MNSCRERKLLGTLLFSNILSLVSCSQLCFENLALAHFFGCWLNIYLFFFAEDFVENIEEVCSSWGISFFEDSDDEHYVSPLMNLRHYHYLSRYQCDFWKGSGTWQCLLAMLEDWKYSVFVWQKICTKPRVSKALQKLQIYSHNKIFKIRLICLDISNEYVNRFFSILDCISVFKWISILTLLFCYCYLYFTFVFQIEPFQ